MNFYSSIIEKINDASAVASNTNNKPEAILRELVTPLWNECLIKKGIALNFIPQDERIFANGRADTVFNRLILEYKKPGVIQANNKKNWKLIAQVRNYIEDLAEEERWKENRLLGVAFDGKYFLYIQKMGRWISEEPIALSEESLERFILTIEKLTSKAALIPDNLIRDFAVGTGSLNYIAANAIKACYFTLTKTKNERVKTFFNQWALQFSEVHGAIENKKFDEKTLFTTYGFKKLEQKKFNYLAFFFALDTYYAILMKLLAYQVVGFYVLKDVMGLPLTDWEKFDSDSIKEKLIELEDGGIFKNLGIRNFLEGDLLSWYLNSWNPEIYTALKDIINKLNQYDPETIKLVPDQTRDILKKLYQFLVPKVIRHDLGEYYTPDWLAERCLDIIGYGPKADGLLTKRILDPGCGSGTFLILAIKRSRENAKYKKLTPQETLNAITRNIVGFDLNPLAVISARTNYILAIADLIKYRGNEEVTIPIYLCDSINPPSDVQKPSLFEDDAGFYLIRTSVGNFRFPDSIINKQLVHEITALLEDSVKKKHTMAVFVNRLNLLTNINDKVENQRIVEMLSETFLKLNILEEKGINGIWSRIIKNAFAPLFVGKFDFIVGNPPWVNWEDLPQSYREQTKTLWIKYGLFSLSGHQARLGGGKKDISMLMTYVAIDKYLKDKEKLCFIITQSLFKTQGAGDGFRRFQLGKSGANFKLEYIDDMVDLQPFEGATNRTALFLIVKNKITSYPIPYTFWKKIRSGRIDLDFTLSEVFEKTVRKNLFAQPIDGSITAPLVNAKKKALNSLKKIIGNSYYQAFAGSCTWLSGVFWGNIKTTENGDTIIFSNLSDVGKIKVQSIEIEMEEKLIYPLLRGREIKKWLANSNTYIIVSQDPIKRTGYPIDWMEKNLPKTFSYFKEFKAALIDRSGYKKFLSNEPFYSIYNVSEKTFAKYKVVWKEQSSEFECAVISSQNKKVIIPDHKLMLVPFEDFLEAHYVCALLNSVIANFLVKSYTISTQQSTHILANINIPKFDVENTIHKELSRHSEIAHERSSAGIQVKDIEEQIDNLSAELWGLTSEELKDIKYSLEDLK